MTRKPNRELKKNDGKSEIRAESMLRHTVYRESLHCGDSWDASGSVNVVSSSTSSRLEYTVDIDTLR